MLVWEAVNIFLRALELQNRSPRTIRWRRSVLGTLAAWEVKPGQALGDLALKEIDFMMLSEYILCLRRRSALWVGHPKHPQENKPLKESTVQAHLKVIKTFFNWLDSLGELDKNPARMLSYSPPRPSTPKGLSHEEACRLWDAVTECAPRDRAILLFLWDTGARLSEAASLVRANLFLNDGIAIVTAKGGGERPLFFIGSAEMALRAWLASPEYQALARHYPNGIFLGQKGHLTYSGLYRIIKKIGKEAGVDLNPHQLRHTCAIFLFEAGASLAAVSDLLGHKSAKTTADIYGIFDVSSLKRQHDKWSPLRYLDDVLLTRSTSFFVKEPEEQDRGPPDEAQAADGEARQLPLL